MIVIHGHWLPPIQPEDAGCFILWAEASAGKLVKPRGRARVPSHAFALPTDQLAQTILPLAPLVEGAPTVVVP